jgi:hypothetical protein
LAEDVRVSITCSWARWSLFRWGVAYLYDGKPLEAQVALEHSSTLGPDYIRTKAQEQLAKLGKQRNVSK